MRAEAAMRLEQFRLHAWTTLQMAKRGDRLAQNRLMTAAIGFSLLFHFIFFTVRFINDEREKAAPMLEVVLVNSKSSTKPTKADVLAQANLDGGGNTDQKRRAKSPLPSIPQESLSNDLSVATQRQQSLEREARELMARMKSSSAMPIGPRTVEAPDASHLPTRQDLNDRLMEAMKLEAQIARDMEAYQQRPKRRFLGARAEEYRFARYVEDWRTKVERVGNLNYPEAARANRLYGSLLLTVSIKADGSIEKIEVNRSSGKKVLDAAAIRIVQLAAPYSMFPPDIRRDTDIIEITRTWTFTKGDIELATE